MKHSSRARRIVALNALNKQLKLNIKLEKVNGRETTKVIPLTEEDIAKKKQEIANLNAKGIK